MKVTMASENVARCNSMLHVVGLDRSLVPFSAFCMRDMSPCVVRAQLDMSR